MALTCDYCLSLREESSVKCKSCGAPILPSEANTPDYRRCPYCRRRLLALASPACNYCGRRLPEDYIVAREADLRRMGDLKEENENEQAGGKIDELIRLNATRDRNRQSSIFSLLDLSDITDITDLF